MADRWPAVLQAGLLSLALAAGAGHAGAPTAEDARAEAQVLASLAPAATRQGLTLQLRAANGQVVRFVNDHASDDRPADYADHRLTGTTRDGKFFVVYSLGHESETTFWVSRATGQQFEVYDTPAVSPDGRFAVTALHRESSGPEGLFIWDINGDQLKPPNHLRHGNYGLFTFQRWVGSDNAELALYSHSFLNYCRAGAQATTATVRLTRVGTGWNITYPTSARDVRCE